LRKQVLPIAVFKVLEWGVSFEHRGLTLLFFVLRVHRSRAAPVV